MTKMIFPKYRRNLTEFAISTMAFISVALTFITHADVNLPSYSGFIGGMWIAFMINDFLTDMIKDLKEKKLVVENYEY